MALEAKTFDAPEETRPFVEKGRADIVTVGGVDIGRGTFEPGWRWSEHVKPIADTDSCQAAHTGYILSGRMVVRMDDGEEHEFGPGEVFSMPPRHDAWIVGDEPCTLIDFTGMKRYQTSSISSILGARLKTDPSCLPRSRNRPTGRHRA